MIDQDEYNYTIFGYTKQSLFYYDSNCCLGNDKRSLSFLYLESHYASKTTWPSSRK